MQKARKARAAPDKQERRESILKAAEEVLPLGGPLPLIASISVAAHLTQGALYRYFSSKEEIYATLLEREMGFLLEHIKQLIAVHYGSPAAIADGIADGITRYCLEHTKTFYLASLSPAILEANTQEAFARQLKRELATEVRTIATALVEAIPSLHFASAVDLLLTSHALIIGLWQVAYPPAVIERILQEEETKVLRIDLDNTLSTAMHSLWRGWIYE
ncbi:transcriptional regulator, TetR family [Acidithiobacillus ferrooxidans ATCC 53993]|jgi:AcrR family transcriptional regulator|uniref:TetR family transcriptional regulator n=1 Tax=Acidithiobacillus ferrooxidans TaxID=920 RepID=UPI00017F6E36|nr:TetR family transcriptional regulator [Acidithiobacillus ferrooxidans]ACH82408.1 transcriptional regulator, TetR family [Acidithiobacillus ferrooxidans ATCC 53993]